MRGAAALLPTTDLGVLEASTDQQDPSIFAKAEQAGESQGNALNYQPAELPPKTREGRWRLSLPPFDLVLPLQGNVILRDQPGQTDPRSPPCERKIGRLKYRTGY